MISGQRQTNIIWSRITVSPKPINLNGDCSFHRGLIYSLLNPDKVETPPIGYFKIHMLMV